MRSVGIHIGGLYASATPALVRTVLGSCISACLFDPAAGVGGMNHFLLPEGEDDQSLPTRYGVHAMEVLINAVMRRGASRDGLRCKVFGGVAVLDALRAVGAVAEQNVRFIECFLATERIPVVGCRVGGCAPLHVRFETHTGRAFVRELQRVAGTEVVAEELRFRVRARRDMERGSQRVTLF